MSKFFKALEEADRDRALRSGISADIAPRNSSPPSIPAKDLPAQLPAVVAEMHEGVDDHLVSLVTPAAFEAEQYRALRHTIEQLHRTTGLRVIAVSSPSVGDGKTLTAINLAGALAQGTEARVLLIDADLRRPALGRLLGLEEASAPGLVGAILDPRLGLEQIAQPRPPYNLSVVCAGATPASPYDVLKSPQVSELLEEARHLYDYIVLDTPPLVPVQDCRVIDRWVDGFLLVVRAFWTPRRLVEEALTILDHKKILGFVFNAEERSTIGGFQSRYYRGYYALSQPPSSGQSGGLTRAVSTLRGSFRRRRARPGLAKGARPRGER
jgi:protein-tyrosine kinase